MLLLTPIKTPNETRYVTLTVVDSLYLGYLALIGLLSLLSENSLRVLEIHIGIGCFILLVAALDQKSRIARFLHDWYPLLMFIFCFEEVARYSLSIVPHWQDSWLIDLESALFRRSPNRWMSSFASPFWSEVMDIGYFSYYVMFMIVGGKLYTWKNKQAFHELTLSTVFTYFLAYVIYLVFPTEGPHHTMAALDKIPPGSVFNSMVRLIQNHAGVHGNAFPSGHVASALVSTFFAWRYLPRLGVALTPFFILICISSVYDNYHYLSDVIGGIIIAVLGILATWDLYEGY